MGERRGARVNGGDRKHTKCTLRLRGCHMGLLPDSTGARSTGSEIGWAIRTLEGAEGAEAWLSKGIIAFLEGLSFPVAKGGSHWRRSFSVDRRASEHSRGSFERSRRKNDAHHSHPPTTRGAPIYLSHISCRLFAKTGRQGVYEGIALVVQPDTVVLVYGRM